MKVSKYENIKALALSVQKLLARIKFSTNKSNSKVRVILTKMLVLLNIKPLALTVEKLYARF